MKRRNWRNRGRNLTRRGLLRAAGAAAGAPLFASWTLRAQTAAQQGSPDAIHSLDGNKEIDGDTVLRSMRDEMERSLKLRVVGGQDLPYFFSYSLTDSQNLEVSAQMGSALNVSQIHIRVPVVEVRVGSYDFDNTGHIYSGFYRGERYDQGWPLDDNYGVLREGWWLATDRSYKAAVESMGRKRASLNAAAVSTEKPLPDFFKAPAVVSLAKAEHKKIDAEAWKNRAARLSAVFNGVPKVLQSGVELQAIDGITYLINSEGTALRYPDRINWVNGRAEGQAIDGMVLHDAVSIPALEIEQLPAEEELHAAFAAVAEHVRALVEAPVGESFSGPTLFEPEAAAQMLAQLVGDNLRVPRKPLADPGRNVSFLPSEFEGRIGSRVLPEWIDITDDATRKDWNGKPLVGFYRFDIEGVPPAPVAVVEKGILKSFLTTRQPVQGSLGSNGHARLAGSYGAHNATISNLLVRTAETTPMAGLKQRLIKMCQDRGKPYGMLVRKLDYPFSGGAGALRALAQASAQSGGSALPLSPPVLVYRVYPDGREELVRGLRFRGVSSRSLRDILAASQESAVFSFINNNAPLALLGVGGYLAAASVVAPSLLFDEMDFELPQDQLPKPPLAPPPDVSGKS